MLNLRKNLIFGFLISLVVSSATAQFVPTKNTRDAFFTVDTENGQVLHVSDISSESNLNGPFAETTLDIAYANESNMALQGTFKIQLPQGALVRDFALRIGEKWQLGTLTEKHKARQTFEEIVRRGLDPAVLAWKDGAEYQARIFPFPAKGKRWIRIKYWQDLRESDGRFVYKLPLPGGLKLDSFKMKLNAHANGLSNVSVNSTYQNFVYLKPLNKEHSTFGALVDEKKFSVPGEFEVDVAMSDDLKVNKSKIWVARHTPKNDLTYLGVRWLESLPKDSRKLPKRVLVFLDTSRSAKPEHPKLVAELIKSIKSRLPQTTTMSFYQFDSSVKKTSVLNAENLVYDGGTDLKAVFAEITREQKSTRSDLDAILFTDGVPTMHNEAEAMNVTLENTKVFFVPTSSKFNPHLASAISGKTGGAVLPQLNLNNLQNITESYFSAPWKFEGLQVVDGNAIDIFPEPGTPLVTNEGASVYFRSKSGRIPQNVTVKVSNGIQTKELSASLVNALVASEAENLWAMKKLLSLIHGSEEIEKDLMAHAMRYALVSPATSYIVLENERDYQQFNITNREENSRPAEFAEDGGQGIGQLSGQVSRESARSNLRPNAEGQFKGSGAFSPPAAGLGSFGGSANKSLGAAMAPRKKSVLPQGKRSGAPADSIMADQEMAPRATSDERFVEPVIEPSPRTQNPNKPPTGGGFFSFLKKKMIQSNPELDNATSATHASEKYLKNSVSLAGVKENYQKLNSENMTDPWFFVEMALHFSQYGEKDQAFRVLSNLFEISAEDGRALRTLGLMGCFEKNCDWAVRALLMAIELRPEEPQNYRDLAWLYVELGQADLAKAMLERLKGKAFHHRFPGMDLLLTREFNWIVQIAENKNSDESSFPKTYSWITWNNDNSDIDFHIREEKSNVVSYRNKTGQGELSNDFTKGYGPEVYVNKDKKKNAEYFVNYYRRDQTLDSSSVLVKISTAEKLHNGKMKITSRVFPLLKQGEFIRVDGI